MYHFQMTCSGNNKGSVDAGPKGQRQVKGLGMCVWARRRTQSKRNKRHMSEVEYTAFGKKIIYIAH